MQFHEVKPTTLTVAVNYHDADPAGGTIHLSVPTDRFDLLLDAAKNGLRCGWRRGRVATHLHIIAGGLKRGPWQQSLFDPPNEKLETLARVKREINGLYGRWKVRSGATLFTNDWYDDPANEHEVCDIRGKFCF